MSKFETKVVKIGESEYPKKLAQCKNAPRELYYRGTLPDDNKKTVAIVGARNCSDYGSTIAKSIARDLAKNDIQIISGLAIGIDTQASIGAIEVEKSSYAVIGNGADICFPSHNTNIYEKILEQKGGIITELSDGTPPLPYNFPLRNRIISGLSDIVIVVEARKKSGSLIVADYALEQGKTIFAVPGRIGENLSEGTNYLIKQGAYILTSINDIYDYLGIIAEEKKQVELDNLDYFEKLIYNTIGDESIHIDQIAEKTKIPTYKIQNVLISLIENNYIESQITNYYRRA